MDIPNNLGLQIDYDFLILLEWELEQAYKRLLDKAQQHAPALMDVMDYESPAEALALGPSVASPCPGFSSIPEDLTDFSAEEEQPSEPLAEELASRQSDADLCSK